MRESADQPASCVVVGGGITGLCAAHRLVELGRERGDPLTVRLLERSDRLGGQVRTERVGEYLIEGGPDSLVAHKPAAARLAERIGLAPDLSPIGGRHAGTEIVRKGRPIRVPDGFLMMAPTRLWPALRSPIFSMRGKLRMACEPWIAAREAEVEDESLASFVTRRFGREVLERVAEPIVAGLYTARAENLSLRLTLPRFLDMEMREGSVIRALRKAALEQSRRAASEGRVGQGSFLALKGGLGRFVDELASRLPDGTVETRALVDAIVYDHAAGVWRVRCGEGREWSAEALVLACSATVSAAIVRALDAELSSTLTQLEYASCATVTLAYPLASIDVPLRSNGFFVPRAEKLPILACSYVSRKFEDRGPADTMVLRAFLGGATNPAVLEHDDDHLVSLTHTTLARLLGVRHEPVLARVHRFPGSMPQYRPGQAKWIAGIRSRSQRHPGLFFAGSTLGAFGLPDCTQSGEDAASAAFAFLSSAKRVPSMARDD
jgi:protoporphyrinogen/coproporphyrinogen III oxidase